MAGAALAGNAKLLVSVPNYISTALADSPVAMWPLNDLAGSPAFLDATNNANNLTIQSAFGYVYQIPITFADASLGVALDGTQLRAIVQSAFATGTTCSVEWWFVPTNMGPVPYTQIMGQQGGGAGIYYNPNTAKVNAFGSGADHYNTTALTVGNLYHVVITANAGAGTFYINGSADGTFTGFSNINLDSIFNTLTMAALVTPLIADVAVYMYPLTSGQVSSHYAGRTTSLPNLSVGAINLASNSTIPFSVLAANVKVPQPLAATAEIDFSTTALISQSSALSTIATISFGSSVDRLVMDPQLSANSIVSFISATPNLTAPVILAASAEIDIGTSVDHLTLQPNLAASSSFTFGMAGDISLVGPSSTTAIISFNGVQQSTIRWDSMTISDILGESPNTCDFIMDGAKPSVGTDVKVGLFNLLPTNLLFGGTIIKVEQHHEGKSSNVAWSVSCNDYSWLLNRRRVFANFGPSVSATTVAQAIIQSFTSGFSIAGIASGLPSIAIDFNGETVSEALTKIATLIGGYTHGPDYSKVIKLSLTTDPIVPDSVVLNSTTLNDPALKYTVDMTQARTQVLVQGDSSTVQGPSGGYAVSPNDTSIPLDDATIFSSGQAKVDSPVQFLNYTGTHPGGVSTNVQAAASSGSGSGPSSSGVPQLALSTVGQLSGLHQWAVSYANDTGESAIGPATGALNVPDINAPTNTMGIGVTGVVGPLVGAYGYKVANVTKLGETIPGPITNRTASALTCPAPAFFSSASAPSRLTPGGYAWLATYVTKYGETSRSNSFAVTASALTNPSIIGMGLDPTGGIFGGPYVYGVTAITALGESSILSATWNAGTNFFTGNPGQPGFGGADNNGRIAGGVTYFYAVSAFHEQFGETLLSPAFSIVTNPIPAGVGLLRIFVNLPGLAAFASGLRLYRALAGNTFKLVAELRQSGGQYVDTKAEAELGGQYPIQSIRLGVRLEPVISATGQPGIVSRRIYRTKSGGSEFFLIGELPGNNQATFIDTAPDSILTIRSPQVNAMIGSITGNGQPQIQLPIGPSGVLKRRLYRTKSNGSIFYLSQEISDNSTSFFTDDNPDNSLGTTTAPGTSTAGGDEHSLSSISPGPPGTLGRRIYRANPGSSQYLRVGQIDDNVTQNFTDNVPDTSLGTGAQLVGNAGSSSVNLIQVPIGPAGITKRLIYRTPAGGAVTDMRYVGALDDNTTTTFVDSQPDSALGHPPIPTASSATIGVLPGDTVLPLKSAAGFPSSGWVTVGSQLIKYTFISGGSLFGIPPLIRVSIITSSVGVATATTTSAHGFIVGQRVVVIGSDQTEYSGNRTVTAVTSTVQFQYAISGSPVSPATGTIFVSGPGSISANIPGGTVVASVPMLTGVSGVAQPIKSGVPIFLWTTRTSASGAATLAALEGGDGIHQFVITDANLRSVAAITARGDAELTYFQFGIVTVEYPTLDSKSHAGRTVPVTLPAPLNVSSSFLIQNVRISRIGSLVRTNPLYNVTASNAKFSIEDLIRHMTLQ